MAKKIKNKGGNLVISTFNPNYKKDKLIIN
jgi:hypothetical protein